MCIVWLLGKEIQWFNLSMRFWMTCKSLHCLAYYYVRLHQWSGISYIIRKYRFAYWQWYITLVISIRRYLLPVSDIVMSVKFHLRYPYLIVDVCMYYQMVCTVLYSGWIWTGTVWHSCPPYLSPAGAVAAVPTLPQLPGCFPPPAGNPWPTTAAAAAWWQTASWSVRWTLTLVKGLKVTTNVSATMSKLQCSIYCATVSLPGSCILHDPHTFHGVR